MGKIKLEFLPIASFDDVDKYIKEYAENERFIKTKEVEMNAEIDAVKAKYSEATKDAVSRKQVIESSIEAFCMTRAEDFGKLKSKTLTHGKVFFRTNPPKVLQLSKKYSVETTIELLKALFKNKFIRQKEEINKEALLADYAAKKIDDKKLAGVGLRIDQGESFGMEINWDSIKEA